MVRPYNAKRKPTKPVSVTILMNTTMHFMFSMANQQKLSFYYPEKPVICFRGKIHWEKWYTEWHQYWFSSVYECKLIKQGLSIPKDIRLQNFCRIKCYNDSVGFKTTEVTRRMTVEWNLPPLSDSDSSGIQMGQDMRKCVLCHMWTTKMQISLRIRAVWSALLLFAA